MAAREGFDQSTDFCHLIIAFAVHMILIWPISFFTFESIDGSYDTRHMLWLICILNTGFLTMWQVSVLPLTFSSELFMFITLPASGVSSSFSLFLGVQNMHSY